MVTVLKSPKGGEQEEKIGEGLLTQQKQTTLENKVKNSASNMSTSPAIFQFITVVLRLSMLHLHHVFQQQNLQAVKPF